MPIANPFVRDQQRGLPRDSLAHEAFKCFGIDALDGAGNNLALALDNANNGNLARPDAAATGAAALANMPVLRLAADESLIDFDDAVKRAIEGFNLRGVTQPVQH